MAYATFHPLKCVAYFVGLAASVLFFILVSHGGECRDARLIAAQRIVYGQSYAVGFVPENCSDDRVHLRIFLDGLKDSRAFGDVDCRDILPWSILQDDAVVQSHESVEPFYWKVSEHCHVRGFKVEPGKQHFLKTDGGFRKELVDGVRVEVRCAGDDPYDGYFFRISAGLGSVLAMVLFLAFIVLQANAFFSSRRGRRP